MTEKICTRCKKFLLLDSFRVNKKTGQLNKTCILCLEKRRVSQSCKHDRRKSICRDCGGGSICEHNKQKRYCTICDPQGHLTSIVRNRVKDALKNNKKIKSIEYLGCNIETFKAHIEAQFKEGMTWENHGEWHIDHKIPLKYKHNGETPSLEEVVKRLDYTNTQPMWASENMVKGNRYKSL